MDKALRILVITDNKVDLEIVTRSINSGCIAEVESSFSFKEGLEKIKLLNCDLIFLDYMVSDSDGISFLKKLKEMGVATPVIFIVSQEDVKNADQTILGGALNYIPKTLLTPDGVSQSIRNAIRLHESQTLRKKTELALQINTNRLSEAQKLAKIGSWEICLINKEDVFFSEEFLNILEVDQNTQPTFDLFKSCIASDDIALFENNFNRVKTSNVEVWLNYKIIGKKGTVKYIKEYIKCLKDEETNQPIKILGSIQDISEQKRIELELINAKDIAEQSVVIKEQFLANMSHEIRTPMNGIIGFTKILGGTKLDEDQKQSVEAINKAGESLMVIINDILDFSKIEANKMTFEQINFSLPKLVNTVIELFDPKAREKKIKLFCEVDSKINGHLIGDPTRLSQILINLVDNALKFTEKGYVKLTVSEVKLTDFHTSLQFSVTDTGIGISQNKIDSIFESFNQATNETTRKFGGTGLGLTITRKLIELQGGDISVKSEVSKGSEFSFVIKYKKSLGGIPINKVELKKQITPDFLKGKKILLVEDNYLNQRLAIKFFERWDKEIDIAENGKIGIEKIEKNNYDIVLMDIQMPEMDGNEATQYIRTKMGAKSSIPIIALTAHATSGEEQRCLDMGMNDYLSKPFDADKLLEKLFLNMKDTHIVELNEEITTEKLVNFEYLKDFSDEDDDFINEMIYIFLKNIRGDLASIQESNQNNNLDKLKKEVHKIKSSLLLLGIEKAVKVIENFERETETNPFGLRWKKEVDNLYEICQNVIKELESGCKHPES
jgi:signal transduction histidine kinase/CheY-like chemotaxis protein/HPt (histidine-containing phosphotransfer) domain-containing protein